MASCDNDLDDIEDFYVPPDTRKDGPGRPALVMTQRRGASKEEEGEGAPSEAVPGTQKVWLKTFGCAHNISDSEYMEGQLDSYGYRIVNKKEDADVWVINSCTVKDPSQSSFINLVHKAVDTKKPIVVAGCVPQGDRNLKGLEDISVIGVQQIDRVVEVVEQTLQGNKVRLLAKKKLPRLDLPKIRRNPLVEIIPLSTGCLGSCTYCKTRHARGKLGSYALESIVGRARKVIKEGVSEIWMSSEDTGAYGLDIGLDVTVLFKSVINELPENVILRLGMTNPPYILQHLEDIAECLNHPNVYSFLHVPVQSGSTAVLNAMNREYTREEFEQVADYMIEHVPGITIMTDFICGFPGETDEQFEETMSLYRKYMFPLINISQFYSRPGTPAAKMKQQANYVKKSRSRALTKLYHSHQPFDAMLGQIHRVWVNNEVSGDGLHTVGHTKSYIKVLIDRDDTLKGKNVMCEITGTDKWHILGRVLDEEPDRTQPPKFVIPAAKPNPHPEIAAAILGADSSDEDGEERASVGSGTGSGSGAGGCDDCDCGESHSGCGSGDCGGDCSSGPASAAIPAAGAATAQPTQAAVVEKSATSNTDKALMVVACILAVVLAVMIQQALSGN